MWTRESSWRPTSPSSIAVGSCSWRPAGGATGPRSPTHTARPSAGGGPVRERLQLAWVVARKDLLLEFRTRTAILSAVVFTALVLTVFNFGRDPTAVPTIDLAPSVLWVTFTFAAMLALNRAFALELENQALEGLLVSPLSRTSLYWGKLIANLVFVAVGGAGGGPPVVLFFRVAGGGGGGPLNRGIPPSPPRVVAVGTPFRRPRGLTPLGQRPLAGSFVPFLFPPRI